MLNKEQNQNIGEGALAIQAGGGVTYINVGLTSFEARAIAMDVAKATFHELSGTAKEIACSRVEEITNLVIEKLEKDFPEGLQKAKDPDFQYALFTVQKEFARSGDKNLGDLLVDLLVDRSKHDQRDILQIVLNESLKTVPKLTDAHLAVLAIIFFSRYTKNDGIGNHQKFGEYLDEHIRPFAANLVKNEACYQHLEYTGCGSIQLSSVLLEQAFEQTYQGLFFNGFDQSEILTREISIGLDHRFFVPCLNDSEKFQVKALNKEMLEQNLESNNIELDDKSKIIALFDVGKMDHPGIRQKCIEIRPYMEQVFDTWKNSPMKSFTLTSVGMAIGHANINRLTGKFANLSIWVN